MFITASFCPPSGWNISPPEFRWMGSGSSSKLRDVAWRRKRRPIHPMIDREYNVCVYICIYIYTYTYTYIYIYVMCSVYCLYIYIYIIIHTHMTDVIIYNIQLTMYNNKENEYTMYGNNGSYDGFQPTNNMMRGRSSQAMVQPSHHPISVGWGETDPVFWDGKWLGWFPDNFWVSGCSDSFTVVFGRNSCRMHQKHLFSLTRKPAPECTDNSTRSTKYPYIYI